MLRLLKCWVTMVTLVPSAVVEPVILTDTPVTDVWSVETFPPNRVDDALFEATALAGFCTAKLAEPELPRLFVSPE